MKRKNASELAKATKMRCGLRCMPVHGTFPFFISWPLAWIRFSDEVIEFSSGWFSVLFFPTGRPYFRVDRSSITKIERAPQGIRIFASGFDDPWIVGSIFPKRFLRKLRENGLDIPDGPIIRSKWFSI